MTDPVPNGNELRTRLAITAREVLRDCAARVDEAIVVLVDEDTAPLLIHAFVDSIRSLGEGADPVVLSMRPRQPAFADLLAALWAAERNPFFALPLGILHGRGPLPTLEPGQPGLGPFVLGRCVKSGRQARLAHYAGIDGPLERSYTARTGLARGDVVMSPRNHSVQRCNP